jgi:hypothetical protein
MTMSTKADKQMMRKSARISKGVLNRFPLTLFTKCIYPSNVSQSHLVASKIPSSTSSQLLSHPTTATKETLLTLKLTIVKTPFSTNSVKSTSNSSTEQLEDLRQVMKVLGAYILCNIISTWWWVSSLAPRREIRCFVILARWRCVYLWYRWE